MLWSCGPNCAGAGKVTHEECGGHGRTTHWEELVISREPTVEDVKLLQPYPRFLAHAIEARAQWREVDLSTNRSLPQDLDPGHRKELQPRLKAKNNEIARKGTLRYLPAARITLPDDRWWVYWAWPGPSDTVIHRLPRAALCTVFCTAVIAVLALVIATLTALG